MPWLRRCVGACIMLMTTLMIIGAASSAAQPQSDSLERQRLRLEVERLQRDSGWQADVQDWLPVASVLVALSTVAYGAWRYFDERGRALEIRTVEGIVHNLERLTDRPTDTPSLNARAIVALRNLNALAPDPSPWPVARYRADITEAIASLVRYDLEAFQTTDAARFPVICVTHWKEMKRLTAEDAELCFLMLERYLTAMKLVETRAQAYVRNVTRQDDGYPRDAARISLENWQFFEAIVEGFTLFASAAPQGDRRQREIDEFTKTAPALGRQLFPSSGA
jgi:hypothetical protein